MGLVGHPGWSVERARVELKTTYVCGKQVEQPGVHGELNVFPSPIVNNHTAMFNHEC